MQLFSLQKPRLIPLSPYGYAPEPRKRGLSIIFGGEGRSNHLCDLLRLPKSVQPQKNPKMPSITVVDSFYGG